MDIQTSIEIKRRKLAWEMNKKIKNWKIINRLEDAIRRHSNEIYNIKKAIRRKKEWKRKNQKNFI